MKFDWRMAICSAVTGGDSLEVVGDSESRIVDVRETRVVDRLTDLDRYRVTVGIDDDLAGPDSIDGVR
ncbi:hypothetical protein [Nocardia beijingensis]